jgi:gluconokinase
MSSANMNARDAILCVDVGSSGCRADLTRPDGTPARAAEREYAIDYRDGAATLDPELVAARVEEAISAVMEGAPGPVTAVVSSAMHGLLLVDRDGRPLAPLSTWADDRGRDALEAWRARAAAEDWYGRTGAPDLSHFPLYRLLRMRAMEPDLLDRAHKILSLKSWLMHRWTGETVEDHTLAAGTGCLRMKDRCWDPEILEAAGLQFSSFPEPAKTSAAFVPSSGRLPDSIKSIIIGSGDGPLAHLGAAGRDPDTCSITIGTSGAVRRLGAAPWIDSDLKTWTYPLDQTAWISGVATNNAGNVLDHFLKVAGRPRLSALDLDRILGAPASRPRLIASPFLLPERNALIKTPRPFGILETSSAHDQRDRLRAIVEGIVFNLVFLHETLAASRRASGVALTGALAESRCIQEIFAALLPVPVYARAPGTAALEGARLLIAPRESSARVAIEPSKDQGLLETYCRWKKACAEDRRAHTTSAP